MGWYTPSKSSYFPLKSLGFSWKVQNVITCKPENVLQPFNFKRRVYFLFQNRGLVLDSAWFVFNSLQSWLVLCNWLHSMIYIKVWHRWSSLLSRGNFKWETDWGRRHPPPLEQLSCLILTFWELKRFWFYLLKLGTSSRLSVFKALCQPEFPTIPPSVSGF